MNKKQLRILIAPLDWGLGHVTRCLPLIQFIISQGHKVVFAGNESQRQYVKTVFPSIEYLELRGYDIQYARSRIGFLPKIIGQIPRIKRGIRSEQQWLQQVIKIHNIDAVISDNRYGLYHQAVPCVILTHQLQVRSGYSRYIDQALRKLHYRYLEKFGRCWVVDTKENGLSGMLGHPPQLPRIRTEFIGLLSQCAGKPTPKHKKDGFIVLILLSGTEPQRSILADILWKKAVKSEHHIIFVAGSEKAAIPVQVPGHISFHQRLSAEDLLTAIEAASIVICRSGYSSLMDLIALKKKAILIPTPGQTEQEYLAKQMQERKVFMMAHQHKFDIQTSLLNASLFPFEQDRYGQHFDDHKPVLAGMAE